MSYQSLDAERLRAIAEEMGRMAPAPLGPDEVAKVATFELKKLTNATWVELRPTYGGGDNHEIHDDFEGKVGSISVPVECHGCQIGLLTIATDDEAGFSRSDVEILRLVGEYVSSLLCEAVSHSDSHGDRSASTQHAWAG
jgi:GAF domain-containing protein